MEKIPKDIRYTQVPNIILDEILSTIKSSELKVCMLICRKTFGFHKKKDSISLSQMTKLTGLAKNTVIKAIERLEKDKIIIKHTDTIPHQYSINRAKLRKTHSADSEPKEAHKLNRSQVQKLDTQKKPFKQKEKNTTTNSSSKLSEDFYKVVDCWNQLFEVKIISLDDRVAPMIREALQTFKAENLCMAMNNRSEANFYKDKYGLKNNPKCFFGYPQTIKNDLHRAKETFFTYDQMVERITGGKNKDSDFEIVKDRLDNQERPLWKLLC